MRVFVTDGDQRPALAITRSLGRRGIRVIVGEERPVSLASSSKHCAGAVTYPSPYRQPDAFERFLVDFAAHESVDVVIPVSDVTTYAAAKLRDALEEHCAVAAPSLESFDLAADKWRVLQRASACGIAIPRTHLVEGFAGLMAVLPAVTYPAVIKPVRSRTMTSGGWAGAGVAYASSPQEVLHLYRTTDHLAAYPSLVQERIVGPGLGIFLLCDRGDVRTAFAHRRLREKPPSGGVSVLCESVALDRELLEQAARLLGSLGWHGVAMVEFKQDRQSGRPFLMEVNGRFWGSLQLAIDAGVDFPYLNCQLALRQPLQSGAAYRVGLKSRWLLGDLDHLMLRLRRGVDLPNSSPSRLRTAIAFATPPAHDQRCDVLRRDDLRPALYELRQYIRTSAASALARLRRDAVHTRVLSAAAPEAGGHNPT